MKKLVSALAVPFAIVIFASGMAQAPAEKAAKPAAAKTVEEATQDVLERVFSETEKAIIEEYFGVKTGDEAGAKPAKGKKNKGLPPGLAKKDTLPPGLAMQLEKNGRLPPGLEKRDLPDDLLSRLPQTKPGTRRAIVGRDLVLIDETTEIVLDILQSVARF